MLRPAPVIRGSDAGIPENEITHRFRADIPEPGDWSIENVDQPAADFGPTVLDIVIHRRSPERYFVPAGYTGWDRIDFGLSTALPLPIENGRRILKLDAHGALATSDNPRSGHAKDEFFAATAGGLQPLLYLGVCKGGTIWGFETLTDDRTGRPFTRFFVGTEGAYRHEVDPTGKNFPSC